MTLTFGDGAADEQGTPSELYTSIEDHDVEWFAAVATINEVN